MPQKRYKPEEIINKLRSAEVELSKGHTTGQICRKLGITERTYYRWRKQHGRMTVLVSGIVQNTKNMYEVIIL